MSEREFHGHAVINGVPQFYSVSALERYDPRSGGCPRKWWFKYVAGLKEGETASKASGIALHAELALYLRTGVPALSALAMSGMHILPRPDPNMLIEQSIGGPKVPFVTADGIPLIGFIDCAHDHGDNRGGDDVEHTIDPPGTIEVIDWKWKRDGAKTEYFLEPGELVKTIQMAGYGKFIAKAFPRTTTIRLSHGYFPSTRGRPRKVTRLHVIEDCLRSWEYVDGLARSIRDVARETSPDRVEGNSHACDRYGGCPYRGNPCQMLEQQTTAALFGETASKEIAMGLMQSLPPVLASAMPAQPTAQPLVQVQAPLPQATIDMRAQLAAEETAQRAALVAQQQPVVPGAVPFTFADAWRAIEQSGRGFPALGGAAAQQRAQLSGVTISPGTGLAGGGELGALMIQDPAHVVQLGGELANRALTPAPVAPPVQPTLQTLAPPVQPTLQTLAPVNAPAPIATPYVQQGFSVLPPDAPQSNPALAAKPLEPQPVQAVAVMGPMMPVNGMPPAAPVEAPKRRGRKPKNSAPVAGQIAAAPLPTLIGGAAPQVSPGAGVDLEVFIDCIPNGEFESLHPYIDAICDALAGKFNPGGLRDVRCAPKDSPLGFGGWRGAVRAIVIEQPPADASYYLDTRGNEIAAEVADAMRVVCEARNALYVKGIR